jgi:hypothetical protein
LEVTTVTVHGKPTAIGSAGPFFREAQSKGISLSHVRITVRGDFSSDLAVSDEISYDVEIDGDASPDRLTALVRHVDETAAIPNSLRRGTAVRLGSVHGQSL